jgi:hypothetical protein
LTTHEREWKGSCLWAQGISRESGKIKEGTAGKWGRGVRYGWERQREITVHKIYLIVPKGINKDSELSSRMELCNYGSCLSWV